VQYGETDLHFLQRLCEWHGLFYYFEHTADQHTMVFVDGQEHCAKVDSVSYQPDSGQNPDHPVLSQFDWQFTATAEQATVNEYDFIRPRFDLTGKTAHARHEWYQYGTQHDSQSQAASQASVILDQQQHERQRILACSNVRNVYPGSFLPVTAHPQPELNLMWLVVSIQHEGTQPQVLKELAEGRSRYQNQLQLHHKNARFAQPCSHKNHNPAAFKPHWLPAQKIRKFTPMNIAALKYSFIGIVTVVLMKRQVAGYVLRKAGLAPITVSNSCLASVKRSSSLF
jgi:Uncharacterized protein conserved in bacteria